MNSDRYRGGLDLLLDEEHAAFKTLFLPSLSVEMIQTYMAELIHDGEDGGIATFQHGDVVVIYRVNRGSILLSELWGRRGGS